MPTIQIGELKSHLSRYIHEVRRGRTVTIVDRRTPVARIVPLEKDDDWEVRPPVKGAKRLHKVPLPPPLKTKTDVVDLLLEDRNSGR